MAKNFSQLEAAMDPERLEQVKKRAKRTLELMSLHELRRARKLTQHTVAHGLQSAQSEVSKIESRADMKVSTLQQYIKSLGGHLELRAVFPDGTVEVDVTSSR